MFKLITTEFHLSFLGVGTACMQVDCTTQILFFIPPDTQLLSVLVSTYDPAVGIKLYQCPMPYSLSQVQCFYKSSGFIVQIISLSSTLGGVRTRDL